MFPSDETQLDPAIQARDWSERLERCRPGSGRTLSSVRDSEALPWTEDRNRRTIRVLAGDGLSYFVLCSITIMASW